MCCKLDLIEARVGQKARDDHDEARKLGEARQATHADHTTQRFFPDDLAAENVRGIRGELAFEALYVRFGVRADRSRRRRGDGGVDFPTIIGTVDVKAARFAKYLLLKAGDAKRAARYLVLGQDDGAQGVTWLGWETGAEMRRQPTRDFGKGIVSHYKLATELRPMEELTALFEAAQKAGA